MAEKTVVLGAGQAAIAFAAKLRERDPDMMITLIGEEASLPYQRPPLSKKYMTGEMTADRLLLRPQEWYADNHIDCRTNERVTALDLSNKTVTSNGKTITFDKLLIATGARPRLLPENLTNNLAGVFVLRTLTDADRIAAAMKNATKAVIIGGGYIGLEAAAVFAQKGLSVTVIEMADRILQRVAAAETAAFVRGKHESHGVRILQKTSIRKLDGNQGRVTGVELNDGPTIAADLVVVGIGVMPNMEIAKTAGLVCGNGIEVDRQTRTSHPDVHAAGDVASFEFRGTRCRLESVQNAIDQAEHAAKVIAGDGADYQPVPWFWSDQYDLKLQIAGLNSGYDQTIIRQGTREGTQSIWYFKEGQFLAVDALNDPRAYMFGKKILEMDRNITPDQASDTGFDLKTLII